MNTENVKTDSKPACLLTLCCLFFYRYPFIIFLYCILGFSPVLSDTLINFPLFVGFVFRWQAFRKDIFTSSVSSQPTSLDWVMLLNPANCFCVSAGRCLSLVRLCSFTVLVAILGVWKTILLHLHKLAKKKVILPNDFISHLLHIKWFCIIARINSFTY